MILGIGAFAHRGLWAPGGPPENSLAAFRAAAEAGVGIELDVQLSADGVPVVFHDPMLERMTQARGPVWERTSDELTALALAGSDERIPTLSAVLAALPADTPVLVELKASPVDPSDYLGAIDLALFGTRTRPAVMSFIASLNAAAEVRLAGRLRGTLLARAPEAGRAGQAIPERIAAAERHAPDFLAVWHSDIATARDHLGPAWPLAAWTVDSPQALAHAKAAGAAVIFEHLPPALALGGEAA